MKRSAAHTTRGLAQATPPWAAELNRAVAALDAQADDILRTATPAGLPAPEAVVAWAERLRRAVIGPLHGAALRAELEGLCRELLQLLAPLDLPRELDPATAVTSFLGHLPAVRSRLAEDVEAAFAGDPAAADYAEIIAAYPALLAIGTYRLAHELHLLGIPLLPRVISEAAHARGGIDIHPGARIGRRFFIDHGTGVVVGETCEIGSGVVLYQGVTLGALAPRKGQILRGIKRHPTLEDDVTIYAGATILGGETVIGRGSVIGGNVWLTQSVPPESVVQIEAPRLKLRRNGAGAQPDELHHWEI